MSKNILIERKDGQVIMADYIEVGFGQSVEDTPLVIMAHGFPKYQGEDDNFFTQLADLINHQELSSLQFDYTNSVNIMPGEETFTMESAAHDLETVYAWAEKNGYTRIAFIAEGLGVPIVCMNLPENAVFSILFWPALDFHTVLHDQFQIKAHKDKLDQKGYLDHNGTMIGAALLEELQNTDIIPYLKKVHTPTLIFHGMKDEVIPASHLDMVRAHLMAPRINLTSIDDGIHGLPNESHRQSIIHHITDFVNRYKTYNKPD